MVDNAVCQQCGAPVPGFICGYCGCVKSQATSAEEQAQALEEYHRAISNVAADKQDDLLRNGYLPDHPRILVEAGLRCLPLINMEQTSAETTLAAVDRLKTLVTKMEVLHQTPEVAKARQEFEERVASFQRASSRDLRIGCWFLGALAAVLVGLAAYAIYSLTR